MNLSVATSQVKHSHKANMFCTKMKFLLLSANNQEGCAMDQWRTNWGKMLKEVLQSNLKGQTSLHFQLQVPTMDVSFKYDVCTQTD